MDKIKIMFIENFDKIYGTSLHTNHRFYNITKDSMLIAPYHHSLRLEPTSGFGKDFSVVLGIIDNAIKCGIYVDGTLNPIEIFEVSKLDLRSIQLFKKLLSQKILNHE